MQPSQGGAAGGGDIQAQWADYYRQIGYFYGGQQQGGAAPSGQPPNTGGGTSGGPSGSGENARGDAERKVSSLPFCLLFWQFSGGILYEHCVHFLPLFSETNCIHTLSNCC